MAKIAVIGAGNGGCSIAVHFTLEGHEVNLYNRPGTRLEPIQALGGINYEGVFGSGFVNFAYVGSDLARTMGDVEHVIVVVPRNTHEYYAKLLKPYLREGLGIAIIPGSGTSLLFRNIWCEEMSKYRLDLMETCTLTYSTRLERPDLVNIYQVRQTIGAVSLTGYEGSRIWGILNGMFSFHKMSGVIHSILFNMNPIIHPAGMIMNAGWIENDCDCLYYLEASSPAVCDVMEAADAERRAVAEAFGIANVSLVEQFYQGGYTDEVGYASGTIYGALQNSKPNSRIKCPKSLRDRYLVEDVSNGLVAFSSLGKLSGVKTPVIDSLIQLASIISKVDYHEIGMNLEKMGLTGCSLEEARKIGAGIDTK